MDRGMDTLKRITQIERYYLKDEDYKDRARELYESYLRGEDVKIDLPDEKELLEEIVSKLKKKPVYKTLKKIVEGKIEDTDPDYMKGLFSLGTHICIEMSKGKTRYGILLEKVYHRLGNLIYNCLGG